jgi:hypothetical protein
MALTDLQIQKLKPRQKRYEVADVRGLFLRVLPSCDKVFTYRYTFESKQKRITLGTYCESFSLSRQSRTLKKGLILGPSCMKKNSGKRTRPPLRTCLMNSGKKS